MHVCVCVCACVRASVCLSSLSQTLPFSFILLGGYQQPVHAGVCGVMCAGKKRKKEQKVGIHWPEKATS